MSICKNIWSIRFVSLILVTSLSCISNLVFAQNDLEDKKSQKIISKYKIKEIKSYLYPEGGKPGDSILIDHMFFNKTGLMISEITSDYLSKYYYNSKDQKIKDVSQSKIDGSESIIVFSYDTHGNLILSEKIKAIKEEFADMLYKHQFTYNADNEILSETWFNKKGEIQILEKREYLPSEPDSGVIKVIKYYDKSGHSNRIKKEYLNGRVVIYDIGDTKNTVSYEMFFDDTKRLIKTVDYRHKGPHAYDQVSEFGHGIIFTTMVTELYNYNKYGLCSEKLTYQDGALIEKQTWHYFR